MKIDYITAGAGGMICGNCLRDNTLAAALLELGHDVRLIPIYTPIKTDEDDVSLDRVFLGGINAFLQQKYALFRATPAWFDRLLDHPALLSHVSKFAVKTRPENLGELTVSMLDGAEGAQRKQVAALISWMRADPPQVIHLTNSMLAGLAPAFKAVLDVPVVCSLQGEDYFLESLPPPYREKAFSRLRACACSIDAFISPSRDHAAAMAPRLGVGVQEVHVILPGLRLEGLQPAPSRNAKEFRIGYMARISPEKGLDQLAEAFLKIRRRRGGARPRPRLIAAGWLGAEHASYLEGIRQKIERAGLGEDFDYLGEIDRAEKARFLGGLDILSVPVSYRAPKGLYALEAMACGTPVIQPSLGVFPELIAATEGGLLHEPGDVDDLAVKIERLLDHRDQAAALGRQGRKTVFDHFHSRRAAEETAAVYRNLRREAAARPAEER